MDTHKFTSIGHRRHRLCSPLGDARLELLIDAIGVDQPRVLDLCGGKGEMAIQIVRRRGGGGVVVDQNPNFIRAAKQRAQDVLGPDVVDAVECDARTYRPAEPPDLVMCVGARPFGERASNLAALAALVRPGGVVLVGDGYYRSAPPPAFVAFLGEPPEDAEVRLSTLVSLGEGAGLTPLYTMSSSREEFDHYDGLYRSELERYIAANPGDPDVDSMRRRVRAWRDAYYRWAREYLGFAFTLYLKPA